VSAPTTATSITPPPASERVARVVVLFVAVFCVAASAFSVIVVITLLWPRSALSGIWAAKPGALDQFLALGALAVIGMLLLAAVAAIIAVGLFQRRRWARWLAVVLLAANVVPDVVRAILVDPTIFIPIVPVAVVVVYLALPVVGRTFRPRVKRA
jgi:uncharacterized membrane protein (DUF2068 family)